MALVAIVAWYERALCRALATFQSVWQRRHPRSYVLAAAKHRMNFMDESNLTKLTCTEWRRCDCGVECCCSCCTNGVGSCGVGDDGVRSFLMRFLVVFFTDSFRFRPPDFLITDKRLNKYQRIL